MEKKKIILTRGIQGSGKSTWAKAWVAEDPYGRIRFNYDDIRSMGGVYWPKDNKALERRENFLKTLKDDFFHRAMTEGYEVVCDNMNLNPKESAYFTKLINDFNEKYEFVRDYEYELEFKDFFDISVEECIRRDSMRPSPVGENVIRSTWKKYRNFILTEVNKKQAELINNKVKISPDLPNAVIVDLDATLCFNVKGRPFYGDGCAEGIKDDVPCEKMIATLKSMKDVFYLFVTGREETPEIATATRNWLTTYGFEKSVRDGNVYFRPEKDYSRGDICKKNIYETYIKGKYNILAVFEDSQKCVEMYRKEGLLVLQPNNGTF